MKYYYGAVYQKSGNILASGIRKIQANRALAIQFYYTQSSKKS